jgi:predicted transposase YbfD/YdcC
VKQFRFQEKNRGRIEERQLSVYTDLRGISSDWKGLKSIIQVERTRKIKGKESHQTAYFISSLPATIPARVLLEGIRNHWKIESYHYIKDVTFKEDQSRVVTRHAPENISIVRTIVINILRNQSEKNIAKSIRTIAHRVKKIWKLILE